MRLSWSFNNDVIASFDYYIANCSSTARERTTPISSINRIITSHMTTSVQMNGIQGGDYICCVTAKQKRHFDLTICSEAVRETIFELPGNVGTVFFYLFMILFFLVVLTGVITGIICYIKKRQVD